MTESTATSCSNNVTAISNADRHSIYSQNITSPLFASHFTVTQHCYGIPNTPTIEKLQRFLFLQILTHDAHNIVPLNPSRLQYFTTSVLHACMQGSHTPTCTCRVLLGDGGDECNEGWQLWVHKESATKQWPSPVLQDSDHM
jgi:hypothetical protein